MDLRSLNQLSFNIIRTLFWLGAAVLVAVVVLAKPIATASSVEVWEDAETAAAVRAVAHPQLSVARQLEAIPDDFEQVQGYRPVEREGFPVDPDGSCTSPIRLPASFDAPCQAHDLGYDLLRYAASTGHPLGSWAREILDAAFESRLAAACDAETGGGYAMCRSASLAAATAVRFNSWRQDYGVPAQETPADLVLSLFTRTDRS